MNERLTTASAGALLWFYPGELLEAITPARAPFKCVVFLFRQNEKTTSPFPRMPRLSNWPSRAEALRFASDTLEHYRSEQSVSPLLNQYCHTRHKHASPRIERLLVAP